MVSRKVKRVFNKALIEVRRRHHEYLTLEHILYGMAMDDAGKELLRRCGGSPVMIKQILEQFFSTQMEELEENPQEIIQTLSVMRTLENAAMHIRQAGRRTVDIGDILAAMMEEQDSWAAFCLRKQGMTRPHILECISDNSENESESNNDEEENTGKKSQTLLKRYTVELTAKAASGQLDPLIGRERELTRTIEILARRRKNNPLYVGEPGTGKTALAEGLALRIVEGNVPKEFQGIRLFSLDLGSVLAGARYRGDFEERIKAVVSGLVKIPRSILFIDEIHTIVGAGSSTGSAMDASNLLKPVLSEGKLRCIGSTTFEEFRNHFEKDRALVRRFQRIDVNEPSATDCVAILQGLQPRYEEFHKVRYDQEALQAAVDLSMRHLQDRLLPDKAIDVIDEAGAAVRLRPNFKRDTAVTKADIEKIIARMAGIPENTVSGQERDRLRTLKQDLQAVIYGQDPAIEAVTRSILRSRAGLGKENRPAGSFLFYGPTGVGKTELARQLAQLLGVNFVRFDMSEYMEKHSVSRLIGSPPGYVGFDQGGMLTEAVRKTPYALVLLDEVEKAHPDIMNVLLQVMDYATLTDNTGRKADFRNVLLIMTSNAGARDIASTPMGFLDGKHNVSDAAKRGRKAVEAAFSPEFRNRLDALVPFNALTQDLMGRIVDKSIAALGKGLTEKKVNLTLTPAGREWLAKKGYDPDLGARPLQRLLREALEDPLAEEVLFGRLINGGSVIADAPKQDSDKSMHLGFEEESTSSNPELSAV